jgi:hypothetical protein
MTTEPRGQINFDQDASRSYKVLVQSTLEQSKFIETTWDEDDFGEFLLVEEPTENDS